MNNTINFELADYANKILSLKDFYLIVKASIVNNALKHNFKNCFLINHFLILKIDYIDYTLSDKNIIIFLDDRSKKYKVFLNESGLVKIEEVLEVDHKKFLFNLLGLEPNVSISQVKKRYKELANVLHPDKLNGNHDNFIKMKNYYDLILKMYF